MSDFIEDIEAYLNDELAPAERADFERVMKEDKALQIAVERHRRLIGELNALRLREKVKQNLQAPEWGGFTWQNSRRLLAAVAVLLCIAAAICLWMKRHSAQPGRMDVQPAPSSPLQTPAPQPSPPDSAPPIAIPNTPPKRIAPNIQKAYARAVGKLEALDFTLMGPAQKDASLEKTINQAINLLKRGQPSKALPLLETANTRQNELYQEDIDWLLALAWLMQEPDKAKAQLQTISTNPAHTKRLDALELLHQLE
jgi:anti-sigma factor RsiW